MVKYWCLGLECREAHQPKTPNDPQNPIMTWKWNSTVICHTFKAALTHVVIRAAHTISIMLKWLFTLAEHYHLALQFPSTFQLSVFDGMCMICVVVTSLSILPIQRNQEACWNFILPLSCVSPTVWGDTMLWYCTCTEFSISGFVMSWISCFRFGNYDIQFIKRLNNRVKTWMIR